MSSLPLDDWQFWTATATVGFALWVLLRKFLPRRGGGAKCPNCPTKKSVDGDHESRAHLTIGGARVGRL